MWDNTKQNGTFLALVSHVLLNKVSQDCWSLAVLMPSVHMEASITATQHCSCTVLLVEVEGKGKGRRVLLTFEVIAVMNRHLQLLIGSHNQVVFYI